MPLVLAYVRLAPPPAPQRGIPLTAVQTHATRAAPRGRPLGWEVGLLAAILFLYVGVEISFSTWAYTLLGASAGLSGALAALAPLVFWLACAAGALRLAIGARRGWRVPDFARVPLAGLVAAGALGAFALSGQVLVALVAALVMGWALGPVFALTVVQAMALRPEAVGRIGGVITAVEQLGTLVLPTLAGLLVGHGRPAVAGMMMGASLGMALLAQAALGRRPGFGGAAARRRRQSTSSATGDAVREGTAPAQR